MIEQRAKKISLAIPEQLLKQVDDLAKRDYATRSDILRMALLEYVRQPRNSTQAAQDDYSDVLAEHPYVNPDDTDLLQFFRDLKKKDQPVDGV